MNTEKDYCIFFEGDHLLTNTNNQDFIISAKEIINNSDKNFNHTEYFYLGKFETKDIYAVYCDPLKARTITKFIPIPVREALTTVNSKLSNLILRGKQLLNWHRSSLYCGSCGSPTSISEIETAKICQICKKIIYPYNYSAIILLIERENKILLARSPHFTKGMYSTLAGFIEAGESCEDAIKREMLEEVNISVKNIEYFASQPWPFPNSFMLGFKAQYAGGELCFKDKEIEDAKWFSRENLPELPSKSSIARHMIDSFLDQEKK